MIHTGFNNEINRLILPSNLVHFIVQFNSYHGLKCLILYHDYMISIIRLHPLYISFSHDVINSSYDFPQIYQLTKGHKTKCNKMEDDRKRLYTLIFNQLERN